jgi:hypothetical protein
MINRTYCNLTLALATTALLILPACSSQKEPPAPEAKEHGVVSSAYQDYCTDCHEGVNALGGNRDIDEWRALTEKMSERRLEATGEGIPKEAQDEIIDYLMKDSK